MESRRNTATRSITRGIVGAVTALAAFLLLGAAPALAADYSYWYALPTLKVMRESLPPTPVHRASSGQAAPTLYLSAAQDEFEGRQIAIRPNVTAAGFVIRPSDLVQTGSATGRAVIPASEFSIHWVHYVRLTVASYGQTTRVPAYYPDALPPTKLMDGRVASRRIGGNVTQPFYVLIHVPKGTPKGTYTGTLTVTATGMPKVVVPVNLRVWGFTIANRTLRTSFGFSLRCARYFANDAHRFPVDEAGTLFGGDSLNRWMCFFNDHRIIPASMVPGFWTPAENGSLEVRQSYVNDYMGTGQATTFSGNRLNFNTLPMPDRTFLPDYINNPFTSSTAKSKAVNYYRSMQRAYGTNMSKVVVYAVDEPYARDRARVENYGAFLHSLMPGVKHLVTVDPGRFSFTPLRNVDIYVHKLHFWWRDQTRWIVPLKRQGKTFWFYSHTTPYQREAPLYLIDKPTTDSRVQGWFAYQTATGGVLYFSVNRWIDAYDKTKWRDPYAQPLSIRMAAANYDVEYSNGDGSLLYPGYYPALGLSVPGAGPVSSLRMEALRDGIEDYEYLKLLERKKGRAYALSFVARVIKTSGFSGLFPDYSKSPYTFQQTREAIARELEMP